MIHHPWLRRILVLAALVPPLALAVHAVQAAGQDDVRAFPNGPVRIVFPYPPGTANDAVTRLLAEQLSQAWGKPVVVENRPGAATIIGTDLVSKARPDGQTLLLTNTLILQNPSLHRKLPYDTFRDLTPVTEVATTQLALIVRSALPIQTLPELVRFARANPGKLNYASWGQGSTGHLLLEKLRKDADANLVHVPYKGGVDIVRAVASGEADVGLVDMQSPLGHLRSGKLRLIAVTGPQRTTAWPHTATLTESGLSGFEAYNWIGLFAPNGTPSVVVQKISDDVSRILRTPAIATRIREMTMEPAPTTPKAWSRIVSADYERWTALIRQTGVTAD